jgi:Carbohydrate-selective porin, OprB family
MAHTGVGARFSEKNLGALLSPTCKTIYLPGSRAALSAQPRRWGLMGLGGAAQAAHFIAAGSSTDFLAQFPTITSPELAKSTTRSTSANRTDVRILRKLGRCARKPCDCGNPGKLQDAVPYIGGNIGMRSWLFALLFVTAFLAPAIAQEDKKTDDDKPADPDTGESTIEEKTLGLLPNPLQKYGVKFAATYIGETLANVSGGLKWGAIYEGRLNLALDVDLQKLIGADQLTFHANMFQIHGGGLSRGTLQNLLVVSGVEALPSTRLYEAYFEKQWGNKRVSLKAGQLAADSEFFNTRYTDVLTNASMGWPAITSTDLPSGGPSPPLAAVGARVLVNVTGKFSILGGIFDGNQAGPGADDPQLRDPNGVNFRINDPPLLLGQLQYAWNNRKGDPNLTGQIKLGGWRHFGAFADQRYASNGVSLAAPGSSGAPLLLSGDIGAWRSSSNRSTGCHTATTAESACSAESRARLPTVT